MQKIQTLFDEDRANNIGMSTFLSVSLSNPIYFRYCKFEKRNDTNSRQYTKCKMFI